MKKRGQELKALRKEMGITDIDVCHEAKISMSALHKVYRDDSVHPNTRSKVEGAFAALVQRSKASA